MIEIEIREVVKMILSYSKKHNVTVLEAYDRITNFLTVEQQPLTFEEIKKYIFENPNIQMY